jgi:Holliday junction resolvasome RuvABC ATP-dependent DNA helicase subunit
MTNLFVEKYRPTGFQTYVGNETIKSKLQSFIEQDEIPHLLFHGKAGTGKCLDFSEEIDVEIELSDDEYTQLKKYEIK